MVSISAALRKANQELHQKRAQLVPRHKPGEGKGAPWMEESAADSIATDAVIRQLPAHLGWGSDAITAVCRASADRQQGIDATSNAQQDTRLQLPASSSCHQPIPKTNNNTPNQSDEIRLYPDIALGALRSGLASSGRVWMLLQHLDSTGKGWVSIDQAREALTGKGSSLRIVSWRQLRNLLHEGQGVFWQRDKSRIWLRSKAKAAIALDVERLTGRPIRLPVSVLLAEMSIVKAHFYASFHSGRIHNMPISRDRLAEISGVPARTQLEYERITGTDKQRNIAIGERYSEENMQERVWLQGNTAFDFIDYLGIQGEAKRHYVAWWLPNSYTGCHRQCGKGTQRKINRQIGLVIKGRGNNLAQVERVFYRNGSDAAKGYSKNDDNDACWVSGQAPRNHKKLWFVIASSHV